MWLRFKFNRENWISISFRTSNQGYSTQQRWLFYCLPDWIPIFDQDLPGLRNRLQRMQWIFVTKDPDPFFLFWTWIMLGFKSKSCENIFMHFMILANSGISQISGQSDILVHPFLAVLWSEFLKKRIVGESKCRRLPFP